MAGRRAWRVEIRLQHHRGRDVVDPATSVLPSDPTGDEGALGDDGGQALVRERDLEIGRQRAERLRLGLRGLRRDPHLAGHLLGETDDDDVGLDVAGGHHDRTSIRGGVPRPFDHPVRRRDQSGGIGAGEPDTTRSEIDTQDAAHRDHPTAFAT